MIIILSLFSSDFDLDRDCPPTEREALKNIQAVFEYCNVQLAPHVFHISPVNFWQWAESGLLRCNILACLAHLFHRFEVMQSSVHSLRVPPISKHLRTHTGILHSASESNITKKKRREWAESSGSGGPHRRLDRSWSTKEPRHDATNFTLPEVKSSQVQPDRPVDTSFINFKAPIRSSTNPLQTSILARFKQERGLPVELTHSQSFPLPSRPVTTSTHPFPSPSPSPSNSSSSSQLGEANITKTEKVKSKSSTASERRDQGRESFLESETTSDAHADEKEVFKPEEKEGASITSQNNLEAASDSPISSSGSFTVHKRHTFSSAAAAGLPVVDRNYSCSSDKKAVFQDQSQDQPGGAEDGKNAILLTNFLELHHSHSQENLGCESTTEVELTVPPFIQNLKKKLTPILAGLSSAEAKLEARVTLELYRVYPNQSLDRMDRSKNLLAFKSTDILSVPEARSSDDVHVKTEDITAERHNLNVNNEHIQK